MVLRMMWDVVDNNIREAQLKGACPLIMPYSLPAFRVSFGLRKQRQSDSAGTHANPVIP